MLRKFTITVDGNFVLEKVSPKKNVLLGLYWCIDFKNYLLFLKLLVIRI